MDLGKVGINFDKLDSTGSVKIMLVAYAEKFNHPELRDFIRQKGKMSFKNFFKQDKVADVIASNMSLFNKKVDVVKDAISRHPSKLFLTKDGKRFLEITPDKTRIASYDEVAHDVISWNNLKIVDRDYTLYYIESHAPNVIDKVYDLLGDKEHITKKAYI